MSQETQVPLSTLNAAPNPLDTTQEAPKTKDELALEDYEARYPQELRKALLDTTKSLEVQQKTIRQKNIMEWKQLDFYWQGLQNIFWSDTLRDWRPYEEGINAHESDLTENDIGRVINVYRSYGESIIAGLSASIPGVRFSPDNADNPDDISTARAYSKIAELITLHNNASTMLARSLFILFNQSFVAAYNYHHASPEFGVTRTPKMIEKEIEVEKAYCQDCGSDLTQQPAQQNMVPGKDFDIFETRECPICSMSVIPELEKAQETQLIQTYEDCPKAREVIEVYGPLNVQIPFYVSDVRNSPYLILETEHHVSLAKALFPHLKDRISPENSYSSYERWARQPSEAFDTQSLDLVTFRRIWLRPWAYYMIKDDDIRERLQTTYPNGVYFCLLNDLFAEAYEESIDDHWTVSQSPTSLYIHAAPVGRPLKDIQDMTNDMYNLTLRTILYGIPMTFVEANAIDWDKFSESPTEPGMVYPVKVQPGQNVDSMFHSVKAATLSREVDSFSNQLTQMGQFVSGAFPSIFGGAIQGGSGTYKEYESSRNQALQRLGLIWKMVNIWWKDTIFKACKEFAKNLQTDESYTKRTGESYINVWIKRAELQGKVGEVEAESADAFPVSEIQRRGLIQELMLGQAGQNPVFQQLAFNPQNIGLITRLLGLGQLYIPGDDQRNRQLQENLQLMISEPMPSGAMNPDGSPVVDQNGQPQMVSSVPIEEIDDDQVHADTTKAFLVSDPGQYLKETNPAGYQNVLLHYMEHEQRLQAIQEQQMMQQAQMAQQGPQ